ncbi:MAG: SCO family protein [Pseudomonadota bacterium]
MTRRLSKFALVLLLLVILASCKRPLPHFNGTDITGANFGRNFKLTDPEGRAHTLADFQEKYVILFFGFTHCPAVCPTTLQGLATVRKKLGADASRVQIIFVTLDPERDTPEILKTYTTRFDPSFVALRGDSEATQATAKEFHIFFQKVPFDDAYMIDHTAVLYVLDAQGQMRLAIPLDMTSDKIVADLQTLMKL